MEQMQNLPGPSHVRRLAARPAQAAAACAPAPKEEQRRASAGGGEDPPRNHVTLVTLVNSRAALAGPNPAARAAHTFTAGARESRFAGHRELRELHPAPAAASDGKASARITAPTMGDKEMAERVSIELHG
ncbi:MAG TPA: hypothetical protein VF680_01255 [Allosphingosinicella sp.]